VIPDAGDLMVGMFSEVFSPFGKGNTIFFCNYKQKQILVSIQVQLKLKVTIWGTAD